MRKFVDRLSEGDYVGGMQIETEHELERADGSIILLTITGDAEPIVRATMETPAEGGVWLESAVCERGVDWLRELTPREVLELTEALERSLDR